MPVESNDARRRRDRVLLAGMGLAVLAAAFLVMGPERGDPLWLDEAWTIAVAGQRTWIGLFHQIYWDVNAPLYLLVIHLWQAVFGLSDLSLRAPSLIFALGCPLAVAAWRIEGLPDPERLTWAAIMALWFPLMSYAQEARCYALLMLFSTLQCLAYLRLLRAPSTAKATLWAAFAALSILTHYDAILAGGLQGMIYLAVWRVRAVKTWPAAIAFIPAFGWFAYHLPRIALFARPDIAWYAPLTWNDTMALLGFLAGRREMLWGLLVVALGALTLRFAWPRRVTPQAPAPYVWFAVLAALISAAILIAIGFFRPSFAQRYLTPDAPGLLLGIVLAVRLLVGRRSGLAFVELIIAFLSVSAWRLWEGDRMAPHRYTYEFASRALEAHHPKRLVFLWDHPVDPILHPEQLQAAGGAFFHRDGDDIAVDPVVLAPDEDANDRLLAEAKPPGSAILWVYDVVVKGTHADEDMPQISDLDPTWACRQYGAGRFGVYACYKR